MSPGKDQGFVLCRAGMTVALHAPECLHRSAHGTVPICLSCLSVPSVSTKLGQLPDRNVFVIVVRRHWTYQGIHTSRHAMAELLVLAWETELDIQRFCQGKVNLTAGPSTHILGLETPHHVFNHL
jgi:hypothetical protein